MTSLISAAMSLEDSLFRSWLAGPEQSMGLACFPRGISKGLCYLWYLLHEYPISRFHRKPDIITYSHVRALHGDLISMSFKVSVLHNHKST